MKRPFTNCNWQRTRDSQEFRNVISATFHARYIQRYGVDTYVSTYVHTFDVKEEYFAFHPDIGLKECTEISKNVMILVILYPLKSEPTT